MNHAKHLCLPSGRRTSKLKGGIIGAELFTREALVVELACKCNLCINILVLVFHTVEHSQGLQHVLEIFVIYVALVALIIPANRS